MGLERRRGKGTWNMRSLMRRKQVDSDRGAADLIGTHRELAKELSVFDLIAIGVGATIGAGVYVLVGTVAREHTGPALTISFLVAGIAAALSAFCYAELASRCPSAGSAYHYSYICVGESIAWLIGWALILEYTIGGSAVARGISPNMALFFGGKDGLPTFLSRIIIPGLNVVVDPCAAILILIVTALLCIGIRESSTAQAVITTANVCVLVFVIVVGGYLGFQTGWVGYSVVGGYFPYGLNGVLAGSATVFFSYIGFDAVASTAEEVKNPQRDLPVGISLSLCVGCLLYMLVSVVIVGLVPYFAMDPDTPISSAFARNGMNWAMYIISAGAVLALCASLLGSLLPQPRILMAMARDGLLPSFFSDVSKRTQVPVKSTIVTGIVAAVLAFFMDVSELAGMVSVGTLLAFTIVAISVLILRYVPPDEIPVPPSLQEMIASLPIRSGTLENGESSDHLINSKDNVEDSQERALDDIDVETSSGHPLIEKDVVQAALENQDKINEKYRRKKAAWSIAFICVGSFVLTLSASITFVPVLLRSMICATGGVLLLGGLLVLSLINQDDGRHSFGHTGGFICPFIPVLPVCCILINTYLLINLGAGTWIRTSIWLLIGILVYMFYGRTHSSLTNVIYMPAVEVSKIHQNCSGYAS